MLKIGDGGLRRGRREGDPGKSISGAVRGTPGRRYRPVGGGKG